MDRILKCRGTKNVAHASHVDEWTRGQKICIGEIISGSDKDGRLHGWTVLPSHKGYPVGRPVPPMGICRSPMLNPVLEQQVQDLVYMHDVTPIPPCKHATADTSVCNHYSGMPNIGPRRSGHRIKLKKGGTLSERFRNGKPEKVVQALIVEGTGRRISGQRLDCGDAVCVVWCVAGGGVFPRLPMDRALSVSGGICWYVQG